MYYLMIVIFVLGYSAIAFEHKLGVDKAAAALITGVLCWTVYVLGAYDIVDFNSIPDYLLSMFAEDNVELTKHDVIKHYVTEFQMYESLAEIASILFFLIGAMTIVELVDAHEGFAVITDRITTTKKSKLLWIVGILSFWQWKKTKLIPVISWVIIFG